MAEALGKMNSATLREVFTKTKISSKNRRRPDVPPDDPYWDNVR